MKYEGKEVNKKESIKTHSDHIKSNDFVFATSDGNCFVGDRAKSTAYSHAANYRPALLVFNLKGEKESNDESGDEITFEKLMKLTAPKLKEKATELNVEFESDANKATIAEAIIESLKD